MDAIVSHQINPAVRAIDLQLWKLVVADNRSATLQCQDGDYAHILTQNIEYTDFPLGEIVLWFKDDVIFLPSEY